MKKDTRVTTAGRSPEDNFGIVNPPVYHASTVLFSNLSELKDFSKRRVSYGRYGTPGTHAFEDAMAEIEGGERCLITPSGLAAISTALLAFLKSGDHVLMADTTYQPTRMLCDGMLTNFGVETTYYDPLIGADIAKLMRPNTRVVYCESPGSLTFEMQDIPAICRAAKAYGKGDAVTIIDNTWATPLYFRPLEHGIDISIQAVTKYIGGHADLMLGTIVCRESHWRDIDRARREIGVCAGPDDIYLAMRGLRTLSARLARHYENSLKVSNWLLEQPQVTRVIYPALPGDAGHAIWKRDFDGASGLLGFALKGGTPEHLDAVASGNQYFSIGFSWGGFESLILPLRIANARSVTQWTEPGSYYRIHVGLEDPSDLIDDLAAAFKRYDAVRDI